MSKRDKVFLDTGFLISLVNANRPNHKNCIDYFNHFFSNKAVLVCSTIALAEYFVMATPETLPLDKFDLLPFNYIDSLVAASLYAKTKVIAETELDGKYPRNTIKDDVKLFAQAENAKCTYFFTEDLKLAKIANRLGTSKEVNFKVVTCETPLSELFGTIPFPPNS